MDRTGILEFVSGQTQISVSPASFSVESIGGKFQLSINCPTSWKFLNVPSYIAVSKIRGFGDATIDVTFSANTSLTEDRTGSFIIQSSLGDQESISFVQKKAVLSWVYTFNVTSSINLKNVGETKSLSVTSYKTPYLHGSVYGDVVNVDYTLSSNVAWCTCSDNSITAAENPNTSQRTGVINYTQAESSKTASTSIIQAASVWTWQYHLNVNKTSWESTAAPASTDIEISAYRQKYLNGRAVNETVAVNTSVANNADFITAVKTTEGVTITSSNNTSISSKSGNLEITPVLDNVTTQGNVPSVIVTIVQAAGSKVYSDITASLSYPTCDAVGGNCSPTLSYSQTYTWNGVGSTIAVDTNSLTKSAYSLVSTIGASINTTTGVVTWDNNTSTSIRTSGNISITISGLGGKSKTVTTTCKQNAGTVEYKILGASLTFIPKGESRSQAITYDTIWNGVKTANSACSGYTITETSDADGVFSASGTNGTVTVSVGNNTTTSARSASYTISKSGYTSGTISVSQSAGSVAYSINDVTVSAIAAAGGSTTANITYTTKWNDIITKTDSLLSGYIISETSDSTDRFSATGTSGVITISATNNTSTSVGNAQYTISKRGYSIGLVNVSQNAGSVRYLIDTVNTEAISASGGSQSVNVTYDTEWNGIITTTNTALATPYTITESSDSSGAFSATSSGNSVTVTASENKSTSTRSAQYTISKSGYVDGKVTSSQSAGTKSYAAWVISISADKTSGIASTGGTSTITASVTRTWGWNSATSGGGTETGTVTLSIPTSVTGASLSGTTLTWAENKTTSARSVTVRATCNEDTSKYKDITISQSAGYYTYGDITISSFAYGAISAVGGNVSPSIIYSQPYGWNGATSGAGTINGNGDDDYTTYAETTTHSALTVNSTTGVVTWDKNNATAGSVDAARSGVITATVTRNGKTATKTATTVQNAEVISSYGDWSFSVTANTASIAATGGSVTFTISRPIRTITYDTGDTQTQTATSGTFALTRSNSSFTLSTSSISMTSSSLPTFTLSVGATGAAAVAAISSTVTAAFTASNPTTGTTTKSVTSGSITRAESKHLNTNYRINGFSVGTSSFNAAANSTTLSITTERQYVYTGNQNSSWSSFNPGSGLHVSCDTGGSAGTITYGNPSTCTISIAANTGAMARVISVSGSYINGGSGSLNITQSADAIKSTSYGNVTAGTITNTTIPASGTTSNYTATAGNGSQVLTYSWVSGKANTTETKTISPSYSSISSTASSKGTTTSDITTVKSQAVTWSSLDGVSSKNASGTMYIYQAANRANASYDTPTISAYYYATFAASGDTKTPTVTYSQTPRYTSGSAGSAITSGGTLAFKASSSVSGCTLTYSTGAITWDNNKSASARSAKSVLSVSVTMNGKTSSSFACTACDQSAGYYSYSTPSVSLSYGNKTAASGDVSPSMSYSQTYGWNGATSGVGTITSGGSVSYSETTAHANASVNSSTGVVTWDPNTSSSDRTVGVTASVTLNGKTGSKAATSKQLADAISNTTYGNVTAGTITNATIPAGGTTTNYTATAGNGSQVVTYSWVSGKANTSETKSIAPSVASISATASSKGTDPSDVTLVKSQSVVWSGYSNKTASGTMYIYQAANAITSYGNVTVTSHGSASDIPASGGERTASGGAGSQVITYTSGSTRNGTVTCGTYSKVSASSLGATAKERTKIGNSTATLTGEGSKTATCSVAIYQAANAITSYGVPQPLGIKYDKLIPAGGGTATPSISCQQIATYTSGGTSVVTSGASVTYARAQSVRYDPEFYNGTNSIYVYDNAASGKTAVTRVTSGYPSGIPNISGACLKILNTGSGSTPGLGGWYFAYMGTAGQTYICTFDAYVPVGRNIIFATNSVGNGGTHQWLTPNAGLGKWATYSYQVYFGTSPSSSFFFYLDGAVGSSSAPVTWWVANAFLAKVSSVSASSPTVNTSTGAVTLGSLGKTTQVASTAEYGAMCATITMNGKTSKVVIAPTQQANSVGSYYDNGSWSNWTDTGNPYYVGSEWEGSSTDYWASCSIGTGLTAAKTSATVSASAGHTRNFYKYRDIAQTRSMPTRRDYTSGSYDTSSRSESGSRRYDSVWQRGVAASDTTTLSIVENASGRFSLSGTTLSHSSMEKNLTTDSCTVQCKNNASGTTKNASVSVTNSVGSYYDNGNWGSWSDTGNPYYVGSEWEGSASAYWANCSIGSGITAGGGNATVSASAGHTRNFYKTRNIATIRYMPTRRDYTSGSYDTSSRSETSARTYDSPLQRTAAASDTANIKIVTNGNNRFSLSGTTLSHSSMTTNIGTDSVTVRCTNAASGTTKDASTSVNNYVSSIDYWSTTSGGYPMIFGNDVPAGGGWVSPSFRGDLICTFYFVSGSNTNTTPSSTYGTLATSQSWGWDPKSLSSADIDTTNGNFYAPGLGKTIKDRTKLGNIVRYISATWTPKSGYAWGGTKTDSGTVTSASYPCQQANSVGSYYDNGSWSGWSESGSPYYVGSEWEGPATNYWASCSIGSGITAGGGSATVSASAGHTRNFYKTRNIAIVRSIPTRRDYTSGSYDTSSRSESSSKAYDSVWQRSAAGSNTPSLSITENGNSRFSLSGTTLSHSSMGSSVTTDYCTVQCKNASYTSATDSDRISVSNAKGSGSYSFSCGDCGVFSAGGTGVDYVTVHSSYGGTYTSGTRWSEDVSWSVSSKPSWVDAENYGGSDVQVQVDTNSSTSSRSGTVTLRQTSSGKTCSFTVSQEGAAWVKSDCHINITLEYSGKEVIVSAHANQAVKSDIDIQVDLNAQYRYGGGETSGTVSFTIPSGATGGYTYEVATDVFGEAVNMESIYTTKAYCYPEDDNYYWYTVGW